MTWPKSRCRFGNEVDVREQEAGVLEIGEDGEVRCDAGDHPAASVRLAALGHAQADAPAHEVVAADRSEQQRDEFRHPVAVEDERAQKEPGRGAAMRPRGDREEAGERDRQEEEDEDRCREEHGLVLAP